VNISDLLPIEAVSIDVVNDNIIVETDLGNVGVGRTVSDAVKNLKDNTPAIVYLDTVKYLVVSTDANMYAEEFKKWIRSGVDVYVGDITGSVEDVLAYLKAHRKLPDQVAE
jgi:hypothetical protein